MTTSAELHQATAALRARLARGPIETKDNNKPPGKVIDPELKTALDALRAGIAAAAPASKLDQLQAQVDAIDVRLATKMHGDINGFGSGASTLLKNIQENESVARLLKDRRGSAVLHLSGAEYAELMDRKSIISATTSGSAGGDTLNPVGASYDHRSVAD